MAKGAVAETGVWRDRIIGSGWEDPAQLVANPRNFRIHTYAQQAAVKGSLDTLGWFLRVTVNQPTGFVLNGHLRVALALREQERTGLPHPVPVEYTDFTPAEEIQALLTIDPSSAMAGTDDALLAELMAEVETENDDVAAYLDALRETHNLDERGDGGGSEPADPDGPSEDVPEDEPRGESDGSLLSLVDVTIADPKHEVTIGEVWKLDHHSLVVASVATGFDLWSPLLREGVLFCPYPGPFAPLTIKAQTIPLVMVQPNTYIAGHILDRWDEVKGEGDATVSVMSA